eukprot:TRINITY_DN6737_c0_g1_i1.p1 TRINITY_DN6737_c0_g1~~TRINITY_DN6737_c0_g1_i1.p1  ORF type:complete len:550 (-),score=63.29 TRINITY_DN6737_c0_g1_i1:47-1675(-)
MYLGIDCGTQSLKVIVLQTPTLHIVAEASVHYDSQLSSFGTEGGCHKKTNGRVTAPAPMWVDALDKALKAIPESILGSVAAVSVSAQQHGSVYWANGSCKLLQQLDHHQTLVDNIRPLLATEDSPIWMDTATGAQCQHLEMAVGGAEPLSQITGSRAYERFTGNQIAYLRETEPTVWQNCEKVSLVSSFLTSILLGSYAPIDVSDGSGMNLLDIHYQTWNKDLLLAVDPAGGLVAKLGQPVPSFAGLGTISTYATHHWGLQNSCMVISGSGDNNNSLVGMAPGPWDIIISLGTSDTVTASADQANPGIAGHVFCHPILPNAFFVMLCYANGSCTREWGRDVFANGKWQDFGEALSGTPPGNGGYLAIYHTVPEIIPHGKAPGSYRFGPEGKILEEFPTRAHDVRALVEGQCLAKRIHSSRLGIVVSDKTRLLVCGGAAQNKALLQVLSDVFGAPVFVGETPNAGAVGAALRAAHGHKLAQNVELQSPEQVAATSARAFEELVASSELRNQFRQVCTPNQDNYRIYTELLPRYEALERLLPSQ